MQNTELTIMIARAEWEHLLAEAAAQREALAVAARRPTLVRRAAYILGRALVLAGARILRYGRSDHPTRIYRVRDGSMSLN